jgi:coiled-coil domain-containing protein 130
MQGFNMGRYIPPSALDAGLTSANAAAGKPHALGQRARKINQGILTVRFEMPFAVWCSSCPKPTIIAQGVRFNAEKKKAGNYFSSPIWSFRMKHAACGGWVEIRTDPKNAEYVVHEGGKRRDYGEDEAGRTGAFGEILTEEERERRRNDAFVALEGKVVDKEQGKVDGLRVEELLHDRQRHWKDPYTVNQTLRRSFRVEKKVRHRKEEERERLQERLGLSIELLDESEADKHAASLIEFGESANASGTTDVLRKVAARPLFDGTTDSRKNTNAKLGKTSAAKKPETTKQRLQQELRGNTRLTMDAFGFENPAGAVNSGFVPRVRPKSQLVDEREISRNGDIRHDNPAESSAKSTVLVDYDSD